MHADHQAQVAFHLAGKRRADVLDAIEELKLRPALLARYKDLTTLRYDFPLVLIRNSAGPEFVQSLSALVDNALIEAAPPGSENERLRKHILRLEREIRTLVAAGAAGSLSELWNQAAQRLGSGTDELLEDSASRAGVSVKIDGDLVDCDADLPMRLFTHAWASVQKQKASRFHDKVNRLVLKLSDMLRSDFVRSKAGQSAKSLKTSVGAAYSDVFDFEVMSRLLAKAAPQESLPESQRRRIEWALSVLKSQEFFCSTNGQFEPADGEQRCSYVFESCAAALKGLRERLPKMIELTKAIAITELEIEGHYDELKHDPFFEEFGDGALGPDDLNLFPDSLVCIRAGNVSATEYADLMAVLCAGLPVKVVVQSNDILEEPLVRDGRRAFSLRSARLANMMVGLNDVYVLQSSSSNLLPCRERIFKGLTYPGPALFSVFSGAARSAADLPPYLVAAAAMESRAFPAFSYDPSAGPDWASRFSLEGNPQVNRDWPVQGLAYEDENHQRISQDLAFTFVDFVACDRRYARHFARVPRARWNGNMISVDKCLVGATKGLPEHVPHLLMTDRDDVLQKVIVDDKLIPEARRCLEMWHSLQELSGIRGSTAEAPPMREKTAPEEAREREAPRHEPKPAAAPATAVAKPEQEKSSDEAYIETPRCTSCDECTQINNKMFAYDANKQAYLADINAGSYRQLVEAAENCQVSIIHPGKPRNPNEPGLEELLKRAEPFLS